MTGLLSQSHGAALSATDIAKSFGGVRALQGVSLSVDAGEIVALVGPNGSGKTTFISILEGLQRPDSGAVTFADTDITRLPANHNIRRRTSATYQTPLLIDSLTPAEVVELGARLKGFPGGKTGVRDRVVSQLTELGLGRVIHHPCHTLSGGQRKLVDLARALIVEPEVLFLDEPTAGVSPALNDLMSGHLRRVKEGGTAIVLVSHNLPWTFGLCDRAVVLAAGTVLVAGAPETVKDDPRVIEAYLR
ncbi:MAG: ATP-binding cassette domain-containing protein [Actinomycetota bacterium]|nr:ATP-binding cassette domain-containing protein [Actinomycetota bacterium]